MATKKPKLTVYISPPELMDKLDCYAKEQQRSRSQITSFALQEYIQRREREENLLDDEELLEQVRQYILLLFGERERRGVSFVLIGEGLDVDPVKLRDLVEKTLSQNATEPISENGENIINGNCH